MLRAFAPESGGGGELDGVDSGHAEEHVLIGVGKRNDSVAGVEFDGRGFLFGDAEVFAERADGGDEVLHGFHCACGYGVGGEIGRSRVAREGDGFCGGLVVVEGVPDLFGEEGHEGAEETEGGLEAPVRRRESGRSCGFGRRAFSEVESEFDEFEVPVAEFSPEELIDSVGGLVEAIFGKCR